MTGEVKKLFWNSFVICNKTILLSDCAVVVLNFHGQKSQCVMNTAMEAAMFLVCMNERCTWTAFCTDPLLLCNNKPLFIELPISKLRNVWIMGRSSGKFCTHAAGSTGFLFVCFLHIPERLHFLQAPILMLATSLFIWVIISLHG